MANLYGVQNGVGNIFYMNTNGGVNISCPATSNTVIMTSGNVIAPSPGYFFAMIFATLTVITGATPPGNITLGASIGAGSAFQYTGTSAIFPASTNIAVAGFAPTAPSQIAWQAPGSPVNLLLSPFSQPVTVQNAGSWAWVLLFRALDQ